MSNRRGQSDAHLKNKFTHRESLKATQRATIKLLALKKNKQKKHTYTVGMVIENQLHQNYYEILILVLPIAHDRSLCKAGAVRCRDHNSQKCRFILLERWRRVLCTTNLSKHLRQVPGAAITECTVLDVLHRFFLLLGHPLDSTISHHLLIALKLSLTRLCCWRKESSC